MSASKCQLAFAAPCLLLQVACSEASDSAAGKLVWSSNGAISEMHSVEVDCGDAQYRISISKRRMGPPELDVLQRVPVPFSEEIISSFAEIVDDFSSVDTIAASCGSDPDESPRDEVLASNRNEDFSGKIQITLGGSPSAHTGPSHKECREKGGVFAFATTRVATLSLDSIDIKPGMIGTCYLPGRIKVSE